MPSFVRRFRIAAGGIVVAIVIVSVSTVTAFIVTGAASDVVGTLIIVVGALAFGIALTLAALGSVRRARALRWVTAQHPEGLVFIARRQPAVVSDLSVYLSDREIIADVADRWLVGLVDHRGISVWSVAREPSELLIMPWDELGAIEVTDLESGGRQLGIAVDVRPFETPLIVAIGYAAYGITASLGRNDVADICRRVNGLRPAAEQRTS